MVRLIAYLLLIVLIASGLSWLADRPGTLQIVWQGYDIETSVFRAIVLLAALLASFVFLWSVFRAVLNGPAAFGRRLLRNRQKKGFEALSSGMIAVGAGDAALASRYALQARKSLPHEPLTHLLRARSAELSGDRATARRIYEAMLSSPETEQLGLRGLFLEAEHESAGEAARQFAARALKANAKLGWSATALFDQQCKQKDWMGALATLDQARKNGHVSKAAADRKRAVLLTAKAVEAEEGASDKALAFALEAHSLAPDLVPAAVIAGRLLASRGNTSKAAKVLQKTWVKSPHPDIALTYAYARIGDSTRDRLDRVRQLAALSPHSIESPIAVATTAIDARMYDEARAALEPLLADRLTQRVATLMARIEAGENGEHGRVREWLARAVHAPSDPVWMADGVISDHWEPTSPIDGRLDAFQWRVPVESREAGRNEILAQRLEELIAIEAPVTTAVVVPVEEEAAPASASPVMPDKADIIEAAPAIAATTGPNGGSGSPASVEAAAETGAEEPSTEAAPAAVIEKARTATAKSPPARRAEERRGSRKAATEETDIFVSLRAPDDPGTEAAEIEPEQPLARRSFRTIN